METNTENDLKEIEEIRDRLNNGGIDIGEELEQSLEIAERNIFKGGCKKEFENILGEISKCGIEDNSGDIRLCPDCQKEKERCDKIQKIYKEIING